MAMTSSLTGLRTRFLSWFLQDRGACEKVNQAKHTYPWWKVMCLTGLDYFSTLGYQPGIAFLAAGALSPVATAILILVTLGGALPVYSSVARHSPDGRGSISMLEKLLPKWWSKAVVLILIAFAATDFVITMTLSAADATAHILENPFCPRWIDDKVGVTTCLLGALMLVFLAGFSEAITVAVLVVGLYMTCNAIVLGMGMVDLFNNPHLLNNWMTALKARAGGDLMGLIIVAALVFPKLALGLSGFETGVAVMPLVAGSCFEQKTINTRKMLGTSAVIMSICLFFSSLITTVLIPAHEFETGGEANGRALAYLAHRYFGHGFGTVYDIATIAILGFAGSSAMAGLLNLVPRYLPRFGMAPDWATCTRPLVVVFSVINLIVNMIFAAEVDSQAGAYATGVLVLMSSAAVAVVIATHNKKWLCTYFAIVCSVFIYTTVANMIERPDGIRIAGCFLVLTVFCSLLSRTVRSTELRIQSVELDDTAKQIIGAEEGCIIKLVAHRPDKFDEAEYNNKDAQIREQHHLSPRDHLIFVEIKCGDQSEFSTDLQVCGVHCGRHKILRAASPAIPNAIAALLIKVGEITGRIPHAYFGWTEGNPIQYILKYIFFGEGDVAPITREVLRRRIADPERRPRIHVC